MEPLHYVISADDKKFLDAITRDGRAMNNLLRETQSAGSGIESAFKKIGAVAGISFGVAQIRNFAREIISVRSQIQMLEQSFSVLLGSKARADAMLVDIKEIALKSPLSLTDTSNAAQMLLSFNIEAEKVIPTLRMLGDISMGNSDRFRSLTLAFAQMSSAGRLMGQDLLQMINAGFNPLQVMSEKTGKSISALKDEMSKGVISSEMVADAFRSATAEGGKFHNMMEKQAEGIAGLQASLGDAWTNMLNQLGEKSEGVIEKGYRMTAALVENYEKVGKVLVALIATYGTYRAAVALNIAVEKGYTVAQLAHYNALLLLEKAQKALNIAMKANPYVLMATVVAGLVTAMWALHDSTTAEEKAQNRLNDLLEESKARKDKLITATDELTRKIKDESATVYEQIKAWKLLQNELPELYAKMTIEEFRNLTNEQIRHMNATAADAREVRDANKEYEDAVKKVERLKEGLELASKSGNGGNWAYLGMLSKELNDAEINAKAAKDALDKVNKTREEAEFQKKPAAERLAYYEEEKKKLEEEKKKLEDIAVASENIAENWKSVNFETVLNLSRLEDVNGKINEIRGNISALKETTAVQQYGDAYKGAKKDWEDAKKELREIEKDKDKFSVEQYENAKKRAESTKKAYEDLGGDTSTKNVEKQKRDANAQKIEAAERLAAIKESQEKIRQQETDGELEIQQLMIDLMTEGLAKQIAQIDLNYEKRKNEVAKKGAELIRQYQEIERKEWEAANPDWKEKGKTFTPATISIAQLPQNVQTQLESMMAAVVAEWQKGHADLIKDGEAAMNDYLKEYGTFEERRLAITKEYNEKIAKETTGGGKLKLGKELDKELKDLDRRMGKSKKIWTVLMGDLGGLTSEMLKDYIARAEELVKESEDSASDETKNMIEAIENARKFLAKKNPFREMHDALTKYKEAVKEGDVEGASKYFSRFNAAAEEVKSTINAITSSLGSVGGLVSDDLQRAIESVGGIVEGVAGAIQAFGNESASAGNKIKGISGIISAVTTIIGDLANAFGEPTRAAREFLEFQERFANEYFLSMQKIKDVDYGTIFGTNSISKAIDAYNNLMEVQRHYEISQRRVGEAARENSVSMDLWGKEEQKQAEARRKALREGYNEVQSMTLLVSEANFWQKLVGKGSRYTTLKDLAPELWDDNGIFNADAAKVFLETNDTINKSNNRAQKETLENLVKLKEADEELLAIIDSQLSSIFGHLSEDLTDSIFDSVRKGSDAWDLFEDAGLKVIDTLGKQLVKEMYIQAYLDTFRDRMRAAYETGDIEQTQKELAQIMTDIYNGMGSVLNGAQQAAKDWDKMASGQGWDMSKLVGAVEENVREGSKGLAASMTQDQASEMNGFLNNGLLFWREIAGNTGLILANLTNQQTANSAELMRNYAQNALAHLANIDNNTGRLEAIERDISGINAGIDRMTTWGVKMR